MPVTLQFCFTHFETHVQMLAQSGSRHLSAAAPCLERINPLSSNLFCFQNKLMRIDAYQRLCSLRVRLLSMARFNYSFCSILLPLPGSAILSLFRRVWPRKRCCFEDACAGGMYLVRATTGRQQYAHASQNVLLKGFSSLLAAAFQVGTYEYRRAGAFSSY